MLRGRRLLFLLAAGAVAIPAVAWAQAAGSAAPTTVTWTNHGQLDQITNNFQAVSNLWEANIARDAQRLFWALVGIDFIWMGIQAALKTQGFQDLTAQFVREVFFIGFGQALLTYGQTWATAIVSSFQSIGAQAVADSSLGTGVGDLAVSGNLSPSAILGIGLKYAGAFAPAIGVSSVFSIGAAITMGFLTILVVLGFALMAVREVMVLAEVYLILSAGVIVLGFGGSRWTKSIAEKYLRYAVSVGIKLFFLQLVVALSVAFLNSLTIGRQTADMGNALTLVGSLMVCVVLIFVIPNIAASFARFGESSLHGGEAMALAMTAASTVTNTALLVAKLAAAPATGGASAATAPGNAGKAASSALRLASAAGGDGGASSGGSNGAGAKNLSAGMGKPAGSSVGTPEPPILK